MATHFSILAWRIPWTEKLGMLQSIESQRVGYNSSDLACSPQTVTDLPLLFQFGFSISFPFLFAVSRISKPMFNKSGETVHPCLIPDLRDWNAFSFSSSSMIIAMGLSYIDFIILRYAHSLGSLFVNHKWMLSIKTKQDKNHYHHPHLLKWKFYASKIPETSITGDWDRTNLFMLYSESMYNKDYRSQTSYSGKKKGCNPHNTVPYPG